MWLPSAFVRAYPLQPAQSVRPHSWYISRLKFKPMFLFVFLFWFYNIFIRRVIGGIMNISNGSSLVLSVF